MNDPTPLEVALALRQAAEDIIHIDFPRAYHASARDAHDAPCAPHSDEAVAWCAIGQTCRILGVRSIFETQIAIDKQSINWTTYYCNLIATPFDRGATREAAMRMREIAGLIENAIPVTEPVELQHA